MFSPALWPMFSPALLPMFSPVLWPMFSPALLPMFSPVLWPMFSPVLLPMFSPVLLPMFSPALANVLTSAESLILNQHCSPLYWFSLLPVLCVSCSSVSFGSTLSSQHIASKLPFASAFNPTARPASTSEHSAEADKEDTVGAIADAKTGTGEEDSEALYDQIVQLVGKKCSHREYTDVFGGLNITPDT
ncbi:hypothetical protein BS47DRAFT_1395691 [Hydnum rufescens UP504]|uniref:Uncharacterized protein n=1 Tax=Hydnum rufescens UP504 TaxID=1448309 RepID=A0A9P6ASD9_9AGAM|nr:hypothetical protein BS47DRAFT_1395691 [Hydnum rufescens UP504]